MCYYIIGLAKIRVSMMKYVFRMGLRPAVDLTKLTGKLPLMPLIHLICITNAS